MRRLPIPRVVKSSIQRALARAGYRLSRVPARGPARAGFPSDPFEAQRCLLEMVGATRAAVLDVGANVGETVARYRAVLPEATVYGFEPFPESVRALRRRFARDPAVRVVPRAVADAPGHTTLYVNESPATNSLLPRPRESRRYYPSYAGPRTTIEVEVTAVDAFVAAEGIEEVGVLKLDIQGGEVLALRGARRLLESGRLPIVYTEAMFVPHYEGGPLFHELWAELARYGYSLFDLYDLHRATNGQLRYADALFVSAALRSEGIDRQPEEP